MIATSSPRLSSLGAAPRPPGCFARMRACACARRGIKMAAAPGFYGPDKEHLLTYSPGKTNNVLNLFVNRDLSVCHHLEFLGFHVACLIYSLILMGIFSHDVFYPENGTCTPFVGSKINKQMCQSNDLLRDSKAEFRFLIAFILAGFVARAVNFWHVRRKNYAALCGSARILNVQISALVPLPVAGGGDGGDTLTEIRSKLGRWVMLAYELAVLKARGEIDTNAGRDFLLSSGLLVEGEWDKLVNGDRHTTVYWWLNVELARLADQGIISEQRLQTLCGLIAAGRAQANDLMSSLDRDAPFPYTHLCGLLVGINLLIMSTWKGVEWALWLHAMGGAGLIASPKWWVDMVVLVSWNVSYKALYDVVYVLHNPFGSRRIDVAHEVIGGGIRRLSNALMAGNPSLPPRGLEPSEGRPPPPAQGIERKQEQHGAREHSNPLQYRDRQKAKLVNP
eukprot:g3693.t1